MFIHKKTVIFIPYFDSPFCLINYWQNGGFFLKSEIPGTFLSLMKKENRFPYGKRPFSSSPYNKLCQLVSMLHLRKRPGKYRICIAHKPLESTFPMRGATAKHQFSVPLLKLESTLPMRGATYVTRLVSIFCAT